MKNSNLIMALVSYCILITSCEKDTDPYSKIVTDNPLKSHIDSLVHNTFKDYAIQSATAGFSIAVIDGSQIDYYNYGETKKENKILPDKNTLYEIGSITKTFTAAALLYWLNQNSIDINTAIKSYLPQNLSANLGLNGVDITFKHLLNHTSGMPLFPNDRPPASDLVTDYDSTKLYNYISSHPLLRTPGTPPTTVQEAGDFYSSMAYGLAGIILERQTKQPLQNIFQNFIFQPLQMTSTTLNEIENITNRAYPHNDSGPITYSFLSAFAGGGALRSNLNDLVKYVQAQINATNDNSLGQAMLQSQNPTIQIYNMDYYSLGWAFFYTLDKKELIYHAGRTGGFSSFITFDKNSQKATAILFNNNSGDPQRIPVWALSDEYFK
jgi:CubicO group peptidase (beta-lactamase class C family)